MQFLRTSWHILQLAVENLSCLFGECIWSSLNLGRGSWTALIIRNYSHNYATSRTILNTLYSASSIDNRDFANKMNKRLLFKNVCIVYILLYAMMLNKFVDSTSLARGNSAEIFQIWITQIIPPSLLITLIRYLTVKQWLFPFIADKLIVAEKYQFGLRKRRISLVAKQLFKLILYTSLHFFLGYRALRNVDWVPSSFLIGTTNESTESIFERLAWDSDTLHHLNLPDDVQLYFNLVAAYNLHEMGWLLLYGIGDYNFWEMLLHHIVTLSLIVLCFITKHTAIGCLVMILHGLTDIPGALNKMFSNSSLYAVTFAFYLVTLYSWCYYRLYVLVGSIIQPIYDTEYKLQIQSGNNEYSEPMCYVMLLSTLAVLHVFWIALLFKMGYRFIAKGKAHDSVAIPSSDSENMDEVDKDRK